MAGEVPVALSDLQKKLTAWTAQLALLMGMWSQLQTTIWLVSTNITDGDSFDGMVVALRAQIEQLENFEKCLGDMKKTTHGLASEFEALKDA